MDELTALLGRAYVAKTRRQSNPTAPLHEALAKDRILRQSARMKREALAQVVAARSAGGQCSAYVEKTHLASLDEALTGLEV